MTVKIFPKHSAIRPALRHAIIDGQVTTATLIRFKKATNFKPDCPWTQCPNYMCEKGLYATKRNLEKGSKHYDFHLRVVTHLCNLGYLDGVAADYFSLAPWPTK